MRLVARETARGRVFGHDAVDPEAKRHTGYVRDGRGRVDFGVSGESGVDDAWLDTYPPDPVVFHVFDGFAYPFGVPDLAQGSIRDCVRAPVESQRGNISTDGPAGLTSDFTLSRQGILPSSFNREYLYRRGPRTRQDGQKAGTFDCRFTTAYRLSCTRSMHHALCFMLLCLGFD
ncbi:hypothetical protein RSAG8_12401, partial [Rhizoctonia solani AG-8 WAC10335]